MRRTPFDSGREFRPKPNRFLEMGGRAPAFHRSLRPWSAPARGAVRPSVTADRSRIGAGGTDLAYLHIALTGENGVVRPTGPGEITVTVTAQDGPGTTVTLHAGAPTA